jgi:hypothetical protein
MSEILLKNFIRNHNDFEIKHLESKSIVEITKTDFESEEDFYQIYKYVYLCKDKLSDVDLDFIRLIYDKNIPGVRIRFTILKLINYIPLTLFLISIYLPFYFKNYWLLFFSNFLYFFFLYWKCYKI